MTMFIVRSIIFYLHSIQNEANLVASGRLAVNSYPGPSVFPTGHSLTVFDRSYVVRKSTDTCRYTFNPMRTRVSKFIVATNRLTDVKCNCMTFTLI